MDDDSSVDSLVFIHDSPLAPLNRLRAGTVPTVARGNNFQHIKLTDDVNDDISVSSSRSGSVTAAAMRELLSKPQPKTPRSSRPTSKSLATSLTTNKNAQFTAMKEIQKKKNAENMQKFNDQYRRKPTSHLQHLHDHHNPEHIHQPFFNDGASSQSPQQQHQHQHQHQQHHHHHHQQQQHQQQQQMHNNQKQRQAFKVGSAALHELEQGERTKRASFVEEDCTR